MSEEIGSDESYGRKAVSESRWLVRTGTVNKSFPLSEPVMKVTRVVSYIVRMKRSEWHISDNMGGNAEASF